MKINGVKVETQGHRPWRESPSLRNRGRTRVPRSEPMEKIQRCLHCSALDCKGKCCYKRRGVPADFAERRAATKNKRVLAEHYHVTVKTIYNWIKKLKEAQKDESNVVP